MTTALANLQGQLAPLRNASPEDILDRYLAGEDSPTIAKAYGVTKQALSYFLIKHAPDQWKEAQVTKAINRKEAAEQLIDTADNALDLARARESLKAAQWDLERVCRRIYGDDKAQVQQAMAGLTIVIRSEGATNAVQHGDNVGLTIDHATQAIDT